MQCRQGADAKVDGTALGEHQFHAAILRYPLFRNVEAGDDLDPRGNLVLDDEGRRCDFAQNAVNPETYPVKLLVGFEMDVGGAIVDGIKKHFLDEFDDRCVVDVLRGDFLSAALRVFVSKLQVDVLTTQIFQ